MKMTRINNTTPNRRGFTMIEIMVTIGILVLVAAGVSTIFTAVAETVNKGRRVAELNRFAAQFERVMRQDFEDMTRDGFLVIVNQYAPGDDPNNAWDDHDVQLSPADASDLNDNGDPGRPRRVDEIMFFARAEYETSRRAISSGLAAKSSEAAIYYGHGQKRRPDLIRPFNDPINSNNLFFVPKIDDTNFDLGGIENAWLGTIPTDGIPNPNQYAIDWSLLRHVTLLANPESSGQAIPDEVFGLQRSDADYRPWLEDSARQIALQPAMQTIFSSLNFYTASADMPRWFKEYTSGGFTSATDSKVFRASGLVDIVTTDIPSIANIIRFGPGDGNWIGSLITLQTDTNPFDAFKAKLDLGGALPISVSPPQWNIPTSAIAQQRHWMLDAMPSLWDITTDPPEQQSRVRYEDIPTRLLYDETAFANDRARTYAEADQEMLGSSVFVPKCTEFIVEWSMGYIDRTVTSPTDPDYKRMLWYGLPRGFDDDDDGTLDPNNELHYADRYLARNSAGLSTDQTAKEKWLSHLVMGHEEGVQRDTEISMFAYQYTNPDLIDDTNTPNINESIVNWPWPKFIRITISIADPTDNSIEQTFQMVFNIEGATNN